MRLLVAFVTFLSGSSGRPIERVAAAADRLGAGQWDERVRPHGGLAERNAWRREEARLRDEVDLLLAAMRTAADAMIVTDAQGRVRFWNAAAERSAG